ncbi:G-protein-coupled receptor family 3 protein 5 [Cavenderia fasciculata]|uniref:G-protein-coupled receptor family 3 protein 5 n=1 Tax=Cavenderia fasciculata TaxID=261658 RepID=F4PPU2_CACFS|nr:G-protein-coupled receptor family 3 protein 5 [Cavenderia fasciculata]EGG22405.1 G-protein-coupled receptor family 3 protein 5 [Cavenderia fasciculata]|eukprot:XP_004360256.1 G-protein-coupled receptor family 3 protein 5 [Cavenderia fasciculata]
MAKDKDKDDDDHQQQPKRDFTDESNNHNQDNKDDEDNDIDEEVYIPFKLLVIGDPACGKSSIVNRYCLNSFESNYKITIGVDSLTKHLRVDGKMVSLLLFDVAGQERFRHMIRSYFQNAHAAIIVMDATRVLPTLNASSIWRQEIDCCFPDSPLPTILLVNKCDLLKDKDAIIETLDQFVVEQNIDKYFFTSAKYGTGIDESMEYIAKILLQQEIDRITNPRDSFKLQPNNNNNTNASSSSPTSSSSSQRLLTNIILTMGAPIPNITNIYVCPSESGQVKFSFFGPSTDPEYPQYKAAAVKAFSDKAGDFCTKYNRSTVMYHPDESPAVINSLDLVEAGVQVVIGPPYTGTSQVSCLILGAFEVPNLSFYATGTDLSNPGKYPFFNRVILDDLQQVHGILALVKYLGWERISCVHTNEDYGIGGANILVREANLIGVSVDTIQSIDTVDGGVPPPDSEYDRVLSNLDDVKARVIIAYAIFPIDCTTLWDHARKNGMLGRGYTWIVTDGCAEYANENPPDDFEGVIAFFPNYNIGPGFDAFYNEMVAVDVDGAFYKGSAFSYDSATAAVLALDKVLANGQDVDDGPLVLKTIRESNFTGLSGSVTFDPETGDRSGGQFSLLNFYNGQFNKIGTIDPETRAVNLSRLIIFMGGTTDIPSDYEVIEYSVALNAVLGAITGVCTLLVLFIGGVIVFQWRKFRYSSPLFCLFIIVGALLSFVSIYTLLPTPTDRLCIAFPWTLGLGYCIVFGTLFTKTWRTWRLFSNARKFKIISISTKMMFSVVGSFVLLESVFMIIWTTVDYPQIEAAPIYKSGQAQLQCVQQYEPWWYVFVFYKVFYIIVGVFLAFKTRNVVDSLNESKPITMSLYNLTFVMLISVPLGFILNDYPTAVLVIEVVAILLSFTATVCLLFLPRVWLIISGQQHSIDTRDSSYNSGGYSSQQSGGVAMKSSTASATAKPTSSEKTNERSAPSHTESTGSLRAKGDMQSVIVSGGGTVYTGGDPIPA